MIEYDTLCMVRLPSSVSKFYMRLRKEHSKTTGGNEPLQRPHAPGCSRYAFRALYDEHQVRSGNPEKGHIVL